MYRYDAIGNLVQDQAEGTKITWTPYGKVRTVSAQSDTVVTIFRYDGAGNRIEKRVVTNDTIVAVTRYLRDASGNVMAIYKDSTLHEQPVYGSSRLGQYQGGAVTACLTLGTRRYELSNHLGNVLTVITDNIGMSADTTWATVVSASDYYPFGLTMEGRNYQDSLYRYGFNGKEKDDQGEWGGTNYDYGFRIYSPEIGKFLSVDPLTKSYPMLTPYPFAMNRPIDGIDLDGLEFLRKTNPQGETTVLNLTIGVDNAIFDTYGKTNLKAELSRQYSLLISNSIDGAKGDITTIPIGEGKWNTPLHFGQSNKEQGSSFVGGANFGGQGNIMPLYDADGNLKPLEDVVNTILHESIHVYIASHPFEQAYGEDDKMYFIKEDENNQFFFESIPGVTNPRMNENIMMYGYIFLDNVKLSEFWDENGQPLHLTSAQLNKIYEEMQKMVEQGENVYRVNRVQEELNDAINETGKPKKKN